MENIRTIPKLRLALGFALLGMIAVSLNLAIPRERACMDAQAVQPGFAPLSAEINPACIRIRLR